ncbi:MAG: SMI1/KNR4 family protein [Myxococcales bacterium]
MNNLDPADMARIIARIVELDQILKPLKMRNPDRRKIMPHPPATPANLQNLDRSVKVRLPPSYLQLLSIHDGIDNFYWTDNPLRSSSYIINTPSYQDHYEIPDQFLFITGSDWISVGFDKQTQKTDGEMEVVENDKSGEATRWPSLPSFLMGYCERLEEWVRDAHADRAKVEDA